jgi:hypothetical protein
MNDLLKQGDSIDQMIKVTGEDGVSTGGFHHSPESTVPRYGLSAAGCF